MLTVLLGSMGCWSPAMAQDGVPPPKAFTAELIGTYTKERLAQIGQQDLQKFLQGSTTGYEPFKGKMAMPTHDLKLYRVRYL